MADSEWSALVATSATGEILSTDQMLIVRGGLPKAYTGPMLALDASTNLTLPGARTITGNQASATQWMQNPADSGSAGVRAGSTGGYVTSVVVNGGSAAAANSIAFVTASVERGLVDADGNLLFGVASGANHIIGKTASEGALVLEVTNGSFANRVAQFYSASVSASSASPAATAARFGRNNSTSRSINAAGTVNASGADYAEYMTKAQGCGTIAAGDVCGVDRSGLLTRSWADAVSFVVKSTAPAYVGGDSWGEGLQGAAFEDARRSVDRIAFSGQVPVNVDADTLAACEAALAEGAGVYLVGAPNGGGIKAVAARESDMTLPLYMRRLGKVWAIRDGRPMIDVQHG